MARFLSHILSQCQEPFRILQPKNFFRVDSKPGQLGQRQVNAAALSVGTHVPQDISQLERLPQVNRVLPASSVRVTENLDAQQTDHRSNAKAVKFQLLVVRVTIYVQVHFDPLNEFVEMLERQMIPCNDGLKFSIDRELGTAPFARS